MTSRLGGELWGIGRYEDCSGRPVPWAISSADLHADADFARRRLEAFGLTPGDVVLVVGLYSGAAQLGPVELAIRQLGATFCCADGTLYDGPRIEACLRQLSVKLLCGLDETPLEGMLGAGLDLGVIGQAEIVIASDSASVRLEALGLRPFRFHRLGPALAVECPARSGAHFDQTQWSIDTTGGIPLLTGGPGRASAVSSLPLSVRGEVLAGQCACGSRDWRFKVPRPADAGITSTGRPHDLVPQQRQRWNDADR
jgi:hypothetical protein